ncbi:MAG: multidrug ABC transporter ATP-binding protein [Betaproteobacteria bacterium TMED82]|nr:MAG: multidrug ABC transporter ATP-binding protein [Betaproteobacteria bacterium TMED82]|tara:strand:- start:22951 stop:23865 length:915 start_codon:yes stop_codon:yes gene_type:complete
MITVSNLSRSYGDTKAVDDVSFSVRRGEVVGLLGHNGAGKTTVMKILTGYIEASGGTVKIDGLKLGVDDQLIKRKIGYLPENCPVWPEMKVIDYLEYQGKLHGVRDGELDSLVSNAIRRTSLKEKATSFIHTLSRGYRQRVGVAQALLHVPDILILDEPTNGLDPNQILQMRSLIRELAETSTIIVSTHVLQEVQAICERVLIMRNGKLVIDSKISELQTKNKFVLSLSKSDVDLAKLFKEFCNITHVGIDKGEETDNISIQIEENELPELVNKLVNKRLKIRTIVPQRRDLESVFSEVSTEGK